MVPLVYDLPHCNKPINLTSSTTFVPGVLIRTLGGSLDTRSIPSLLSFGLLDSVIMCICETPWISRNRSSLCLWLCGFTLNLNSEIKGPKIQPVQYLSARIFGFWSDLSVPWWSLTFSTIFCLMFVHHLLFVYENFLQSSLSMRNWLWERSLRIFCEPGGCWFPRSASRSSLTLGPKT